MISVLICVQTQQSSLFIIKIPNILISIAHLNLVPAFSYGVPNRSNWITSIEDCIEHILSFWVNNKGKISSLITFSIFSIFFSLVCSLSFDPTLVHSLLEVMKSSWICVIWWWGKIGFFYHFNFAFTAFSFWHVNKTFIFLFINWFFNQLNIFLLTESGDVFFFEVFCYWREILVQEN